MESTTTIQHNNNATQERVANLERRVDTAFDCVLTMFGIIVKKTGIRFRPETMAMLEQDLQEAEAAARGREAGESSATVPQI